MYHRRFHNRSSRSVFKMDGKFSLSHIGGATFLYSLDRRDKKVVGKLELGQRKYRLSGLVLAAISLPFILALYKNSPSQVEASVTATDGIITPQAKDMQEFEDKSEELKQNIISSSQADLNTPERKNGIQIHNYTIQSGDTLSGLASKYNINVGLIAASSGIKSYSVIRPGQVLRIPSKPGLVHQMKPGETIAALAQKYQVKIDRILEDNPDLQDLDLLDAGVTVFLPDAKIPDPPSPWMRPAWGRITSGFGRRWLFGYYRKHTGYDIGIYYKPVHAARDGQVIYAGRLGSYGNTVVIRHSNEFKTLYAHLSKITVRTGQWVKAGASVAISGNTGLSTGPHLHFEVIRNGKSVNPGRYVRF